MFILSTGTNYFFNQLPLLPIMTLDVVLSLVAEAVAVAEATGVLDEILGDTSGKI